METVKRTRPQILSQVTPELESARPLLHEALATLVMQIERSRVTPQEPSGSEEVLLDAEIDGYRYLLLRTFSQQRPRIHLSPREREIVRMVAKGHPNKVIADVLNISSWTVCTHLRRIFAKLGVTSRAAMVGELLQIGVLSPEYRTSECQAKRA